MKNVEKVGSSSSSDCVDVAGIVWQVPATRLPWPIICDILLHLFLSYLRSHKFRQACSILCHYEVERQVYRHFFGATAQNMRRSLINALRICELAKRAEIRIGRGECFSLDTFNRTEIFVEPRPCWGVFEVTLLILPMGETLSTADFRIAIRGASEVEINWLRKGPSPKSPFYTNPIILLSTIGPVTALRENERISGVAKLIKKTFGENIGVFTTEEYDFGTGETIVIEI